MDLVVLVVAEEERATGRGPCSAARAGASRTSKSEVLAGASLDSGGEYPTAPPVAPSRGQAD